MSRGRLAMLSAMAIGLLSSAPAYAAGREPDAMVEAINDARARHGVPALRHHDGLSRSAALFGAHLARSGSFGHAGEIRGAPGFRRLGELLARHGGRRPRRAAVVRRWLRSPPHRALVLGRGFRFAGVGRVDARLRGRRSTIWVVRLGGR